MTTATTTREMTIRPGTSRVRPQMPCCPQRQISIDVDSNAPVRPDYAVPCPVCGREWDIARTISTTGDTCTLRLDWTPNTEKGDPCPPPSPAR